MKLLHKTHLFQLPLKCKLAEVMICKFVAADAVIEVPFIVSLHHRHTGYLGFDPKPSDLMYRELIVFSTELILSQSSS